MDVILASAINKLRAQADYVPIIFKSSRTWMAPCNGVLMAYGIGAGGSGGLCCVASSTSRGRATGGGSGGWSLAIGRVQSGQSVVVTIGAGTALTARQTIGNVNGTNGGDTTVSIAGTQIMLAPGGKGGKASAGAVLVAGGLGGSGGVGQMTVPGFNAGACLASNTVDHNVATGGAAVNIFQLDQPNSDVGGHTGTSAVFQGGMGVGGIGLADVAYGYGGGSGGPATTTAAGPNFYGRAVVDSPTGVAASVVPFLVDVFGGGGGFTTVGGGGGGAGSSGSGVYQAGACAGSGSIANAGYSVSTSDGGMYGGGSGGHAFISNVVGGVGAGGQGYAILYFKPI